MDSSHTTTECKLSTCTLCIVIISFFTWCYLKKCGEYLQGVPSFANCHTVCSSSNTPCILQIDSPSVVAWIMKQWNVKPIVVDVVASEVGFELVSANSIILRSDITVVGVRKKNMFNSTFENLITWLLTGRQQSEAESNKFYIVFDVSFLCVDNLM